MICCAPAASVRTTHQRTKRQPTGTHLTMSRTLSRMNVLCLYIHEVRTLSSVGHYKHYSSRYVAPLQHLCVFGFPT